MIPQINKDIMVAVELARQVESVMHECGADASIQSITSTAEARVAEFFTNKLKEPGFLLAFESYLLSQFEDHERLTERKREILNEIL